VVRVSGPAAGEAVRRLTGRPLPLARRATLARFAAGDEEIDRGLLLWFPAPASFTGEDVAELHLHGGRAVVAAVIEALAATPGLRPADAGEFSRRAFLNGKLDLTQAEGLADLVAAETAAQRRQALRQLDGALGGLYESWRAELIGILAHLEADIDFPDEDLPGGLAAAVTPRVERLIAEMRGHLADGRRGERLRDGCSVAILGPPNVGKSSLLNALAKRDVAIVAATAGTTRDVIEVHLDLDGLPVTVADTAGLRATEDAVESEGVRRARARAARADLKILMADAADWPALPPETAALWDDDAILVVNKTDLLAGGLPADGGGRLFCPISVRTGAGFDRFLDALSAEVAKRLEAGGGATITRARHRGAVEECVAALERSRSGAAELAAEDVRLAARALGRITGRVDVEDILDVVFSDFCIGK
jgi:tRNA modification GTPase